MRRSGPARTFAAGTSTSMDLPLGECTSGALVRVGIEKAVSSPSPFGELTVGDEPVTYRVGNVHVLVEKLSGVLRSGSVAPRRELARDRRRQDDRQVRTMLRQQILEMASTLREAPDRAACRWDDVAERLLTEMWTALSLDDDLMCFHRALVAYGRHIADRTTRRYDDYETRSTEDCVACEATIDGVGRRASPAAKHDGGSGV